MSKIRIYKRTETEYNKLALFANVTNNVLNENGKKYFISIQNIYFDCGQDWLYTALLTKDLTSGRDWHSVCPRDYENIITCDSFSQIEEWATEYAYNLLNEKKGKSITF